MAAYCLFNSNAKFKKHFDDFILRLGLQHVAVVPQLFYFVKYSQLGIRVVKLVDTLLVTGIPSETNSFLTNFNKELSFGTLVSGPGVLKFFGLSILQSEESSSSIHADEKLNSLECF